MRHDRCEYDGCARTARYGSWDGPALFCQDHKRAGMYTVRNSKWMRATKDGNAFRTTDRQDAASPGRQDGRSSNCSGGGGSGGGGSPTCRNRGPSAVSRARRNREEMQQQPHHGTGEPARSKKPKVSREPSAERGSTAGSQEEAARTCHPTENTIITNKRCDASSCSESASQEIKQGDSGSTPSRNARKAPSNGEQAEIRSCIYPACNVRACFGFPGARAVYCMEHKKGPMIRLLAVEEVDESSEPVAAIEGKAVDSAAAVVTTAEVKASTPPAADKVERAKAPAISKKQERPARGCHEDAKKTLNSGERKEDARASSRVRAQSVDVKSARKLSTPSKPKVAPEAVAPSAESPFTTRPESRRASTSSVASESVQPTVASSIPMGGAPSAEMRIIQQARVKARAEAEASGRGRRARVPSLKALQAAGLVEEEGAQVMTRARGMEEREKTKERRELWKAAVSVGLRPGQVLEAFTPEIQDAGGGGGGGGGGEEVTGAAELESAGTWRLMNAEEILRRAKLGVLSDTIKKQQSTNSASPKEQPVSATGGCDAALVGIPANAEDRDASGSVVAESLKRQHAEALGGDKRRADAAQHEGYLNEVRASGGIVKRRLTRSRAARLAENCRKRPRLDEDGVAFCCKKHEGLGDD